MNVFKFEKFQSCRFNLAKDEIALTFNIFDF